MAEPTYEPKALCLPSPCNYHKAHFSLKTLWEKRAACLITVKQGWKGPTGQQRIGTGGDHVWVSRIREHFQQQGGTFKLGLRDEVRWHWDFQALGQKVTGHTCKSAMHRMKGEQATEVGGGHPGCRSPLLLLIFFTDCSAQ